MNSAIPTAITAITDVKVVAMLLELFSSESYLNKVIEFQIIMI